MEPQPHALKRLTTGFVQHLSKAPSLHPIQTICVIAFLVSTTYIGLLKDDIAKANARPEPVDWAYRSSASRSILVGPNTDWTWQALESDAVAPRNASHLALVTLAFPAAETPPPSSAIPYLSHIPASALSSTPQTLTAFADGDHHLAFSVPYEATPSFLDALREIPSNAVDPDVFSRQASSDEQKMWIMRAAQGQGGRSLLQWLDDVRIQFVDLLKNSNILDITTMTLIYVSMHLTFVSVFISMKRLGSNIWLATSVLLSSTFAFLLGLDVCIRLGVPVSLRLLSESLPFLVVMIGFEKSVVLTRAVLSHAEAYGNDCDSASRTLISYSLQNAIKDKGYKIVQHYVVEIVLLAAGAHSGVRGGLQEVCFLAAWILAFDCVLLFTFYTAILCIKLEVSRIRQNISKKYNAGHDNSSSMFATGLQAGSLPYFKFWMVAGFVALNVVDILLIPSRISTYDSASSIASWSGALDGVVKSPPIEPFKVAASGLAELLHDATSHNQTLVVTVMAPVKFTLASPSTYHAGPRMTGVDTVGANVVDSLLTSFEDPILSKWIVAALALSIALNGYLFKAAQAVNRSTERKSVTEKSEPVAKSDTRLTCDSALETRRIAEPDDDDNALVEACLSGKLPGHALEKTLQDCTRAVRIRRSLVSRTPSTTQMTHILESSKLPYEHYNWEKVLGACCENVIGYTPLPVGVAGPLVINGKAFFIPMATTEGVLVASASRGSKAINMGGGVSTILTGDGMTRGPCVSFDSLERAGAAKDWLDSEAGQNLMRDSFNSTSRFARLQSMKTAVAGTYLFIRFKARTGDAMGMNMISKGVEHALNVMSKEAGFSDMQIITLSGNYCADKKPTAINWIEGRGKGIVAEAVIPSEAVEKVLKSSVDSMVELNHAKNLIGSAMAGSVGGFNAQAANLACAVFLATGQDPAQVVEAANCMTLMRKRRDGSLQISVTLPSIEVGTLGGGTTLEPQAAMLDLLGVKGAHSNLPGENARQLARIIASAVLAGETSLCAALAAGHLVKAHMAHNRAKAN